MKHRARLLAATLLAVIACSLTPTAQVTWHKIVDQEAGFTISFPGKPTYQESTSAETGLPLEAYSFYYNGDLLQITFQPLAPPPKTALEVNQILSNSAVVYANSAGTLLRQEKLPDGGRQFDNMVKTKSGTLYMRTRLYVRPEGMFGLLYSSYDVEGIDDRIANQFFSSFSFTRSASGRLPVSRGREAGRTAQKAERRTHWHTHAGPDGDFAVEFPGKPDYLQLTVPGTDAPLYRYHYFFGENNFMISYYDMKITDNPRQTLQHAVQKYIAAYPDWLVLRKGQSTDGSYNIEMRGLAEGIPILMRTKLYQRYNRIYYLTCHTKNLSGPNRADVNRFFESFRLQ
jgi:hypothetical protein